MLSDTNSWKQSYLLKKFFFIEDSMSVNYFQVRLRYTSNGSNDYRTSHHLLLFHCPDFPEHCDTPKEYFAQAFGNTMRKMPGKPKLGRLLKRIKGNMAACDVTFLGEKVRDTNLAGGRMTVWKPKWTKIPAGLVAEPFGDGSNRMEKHNGIKGNRWAFEFDEDALSNEPIECPYKQGTGILRTIVNSYRMPFD